MTNQTLEQEAERYIQFGDNAHSIETLDENGWSYISQDRVSEKNYTQAAKIYESIGKPEKAIDLYEKMLDLSKATELCKKYGQKSKLQAIYNKYGKPWSG